MRKKKIKTVINNRIKELERLSECFPDVNFKIAITNLKCLKVDLKLKK